MDTISRQSSRVKSPIDIQEDDPLPLTECGERLFFAKDILHPRQGRFKSLVQGGDGGVGGGADGKVDHDRTFPGF